MDFSTQKFADDINVPMVINKILVQQNDDREKHEERYYPFIVRNKKNSSATINPQNKKIFIIKPGYTKMKRILYDHTKSLRHCDWTFSINNVLTDRRDLLVTNPILPKKNNYVKNQENFHEIIKKTEKILNNKPDHKEKFDIKTKEKFRILTAKHKKKNIPISILIPSIRAQTILPGSRKKTEYKMIDQEIGTDYQNAYT